MSSLTRRERYDRHRHHPCRLPSGSSSTGKAVLKGTEQRDLTALLGGSITNDANKSRTIASSRRPPPEEELPQTGLYCSKL